LAKNIHAVTAKPDENKQPGKEDKLEKGIKLKNIKKDDDKGEGTAPDKCKC
jgi:hypothetical protein